MNSGTRPLTSAGVIRFPLDEGEWQDAEDSEIVAEGASEIVVRGQALPLPAPDEYADHGIELERPPRVQVFELCRFLGDVARDQVLATPQERRVNMPHRAGCAFQSMPFALFLNQRLITEGTHSIEYRTGYAARSWSYLPIQACSNKRRSLSFVRCA